jgi:hypothetical protein
MDGIGENIMGMFNETNAVAPKVQEDANQAKIKTDQTEAPIETPVEEKQTETTQTIVDVKNTETPIEGQSPKDLGVTVKENDNPNTAVVEQTKQLELSEDAVLAYLKKSSGKELTSINDLFKEPEKSLDPFEGLSDDAVQFLKYNKETGRSFNDFQELNTDYTKLTPLQVAEKRAIELSGGELEGEEIYQYLEKKLNIDLSDIGAIDKFDLIELKNFGKEYLEKKVLEKETYKKPVERDTKGEGPEMVTLENGVQMQKTEYDKAVIQRQNFEKLLKDSTDNITSSDFKIKIDDNGTETFLDLSYDYSKDEKHNMFSSALDANKSIQEMFSTDNGFDFAGYQQAMYRANPINFGKIVNSLVNKARAEWVEESVKQRTNANFTTKQMPSNNQNSGNGIKIPGTQNNYGIQYDFTNS